jgi:hypothetical protein
MVANEIDPGFEAQLYRHVASLLLRSLGARAISCAHTGIAKVSASGDDEALTMWMAIHAELVSLAPGTIAGGHTCH